MIYEKNTRITRRNGNTIALRIFLEKCIRAVFFEMMDCPIDHDFIDFGWEQEYFWTAPHGTMIHEQMQRILGLDQMEYTEKSVLFNFLSSIKIRTNCDGIDTRNPDSFILYEFKTKNPKNMKLVNIELQQAALTAFLFRREHKLPIRGISLWYINREKPSEINIYNYDLENKNSEKYLDIQENLRDVMEKGNELNESLEFGLPPSMNSRFVILEKFLGKYRKTCNQCRYKTACTRAKHGLDFRKEIN